MLLSTQKHPAFSALCSTWCTHADSINKSPRVLALLFTFYMRMAIKNIKITVILFVLLIQ